MSDNQEPMGVPIILQSTQFATFPAVQTETRQQLLEHTMHDKNAANISTLIVLGPGDSAFDATRDKSPVVTPCTTQAEDLAQRQMMVPIRPSGTTIAVLPNGKRMLPLNDKNDAQSDDAADIFLSSFSQANRCARNPAREAYLLLPKVTPKVSELYH